MPPIHLPITDSSESVASSFRGFSAVRSGGAAVTASGALGDDGYSSNDSYRATASSQSSFVQGNGPAETPDTALALNEKNPFEDVPAPERSIILPNVNRPPVPRAPPRCARRSSESSTPGRRSSGDVVPRPDDDAGAAAAAATIPTDGSSPRADTTPKEAIKAAGEVQREAIALQKRGRRNIVIQKYVVGAALVAIKYVYNTPPSFTQKWREKKED